MRAARISGLLGAVATVLPSQGAVAATATGNLSVSLTINSTCTVTGGLLAFGSTGLLNGLNGQGSFSVTCTNTTPYSVALDAGVGAGATVLTRKMTGATTGASVSYLLFSDAARLTNWGNLVGSLLTGQTGNGAAQTIQVYGTVPLQTTPAADTYSDTVTITVNY